MSDQASRRTNNRLNPGCGHCADAFRDGFGGYDRCGYCGTFYDVPYEKHWPFTGICCGNDWWVQEVNGGWSVTLKGPMGGRRSPIGVMTEQPTVSALAEILPTDTDDLEVHWWTTTEHRTRGSVEDIIDRLDPPPDSAAVQPLDPSGAEE